MVNVISNTCTDIAQYTYNVSHIMRSHETHVIVLHANCQRHLNSYTYTLVYSYIARGCDVTIITMYCNILASQVQKHKD